jgi:hypothetical protein
VVDTSATGRDIRVDKQTDFLIISKTIMPASPRDGAAYREARRRATSPLPPSHSPLRPSTMYPYRQGIPPLPAGRELSYIPIAGPQYYYARPEQIYTPSASLNQSYATPASMSSDDASHHFLSSPMLREESNSSRKPPSVRGFQPYDSRDQVSGSPSMPSYRNNSGIASTLSGTGPGTPDGSLQEPAEEVAPKSESTEDEVTEESPDSPLEEIDDVQSSTSAKRGRKANSMKTGPPRPPNAWILYRSEKLKAIAAGERIRSLDEVLAEQARAKAEEASGSSRAPKGAAKTGARKATPPGKGTAKQKGKKTEQPIEVEAELLALPETASREDLASKAIPQAEISKVISLMWKREKKEEKAKYEKMAEMRKAEVSFGLPASSLPPISHQTRLRTARSQVPGLQVSSDEKRRKVEIERGGSTRKRASSERKDTAESA